LALLPVCFGTALDVSLFGLSVTTVFCFAVGALVLAFLSLPKLLNKRVNNTNSLMTVTVSCHMACRHRFMVYWVNYTPNLWLTGVQFTRLVFICVRTRFPGMTSIMALESISSWPRRSDVYFLNRN